MKNNQIINSENKRFSVKPVLQYIRFESMPFNDFALCTLNNSILTPSKIIKIIQLIGSNSEEAPPDPVQELNFSANKRIIHTLKIDSKEQVISKLLCNFSQYNIFTIAVNKPINFHGFRMFGRTDKTLEKGTPDNLIIRLQERETVILESSVLLFHNSISLKPNIAYTTYIYRPIRGAVEYHYLQNLNIMNIECNGVVFNMNKNFFSDCYFFKSIHFSQ